MPHFATMVGNDTVIAGAPFFISCSCGVQGRFASGGEAARYVGIHFAGQNQADTLVFTDNSGLGLVVAYQTTQAEGSVPELTGLAQE